MPYSIPKIDGGTYNYSSASVNTLKEALEAGALAGDLLSGCSIVSASYVDISGANLRNLKIPGSRLFYCDFSESDLTNSDLSYCFGSPYLKCKFIGSTLINSNLNYITFYGPYADFSNANLTNAKLGNALFYSTVFSETNLTNVIFSDVSVSGIPTFNGCNLSNTNFSNKNLIGFNFNNCNLSRANFSNCDSRNFTSYTYPHEFDIFINCNLTNANFSSSNLTGQILTGNTLTYCNFTDAILNSAILTNIISGSNCNFTRTDLQYSNLSFSNFSNSYLKECTFADVTLKGTILSECNLQYSNWDDINPLGNKYIDLRGADLTNALLYNIDISTFKLTDANLTRVILSACTFSSSNNDALGDAEYNLSVATEKLEADTIILQTISATIANPLQREKDTSAAEDNSKFNYDGRIILSNNERARLTVNGVDYYTNSVFNTLNYYASLGWSWETVKATYLTGDADIVEEFRLYYSVSYSLYNPTNGWKKKYEDDKKAHDEAQAELNPLVGPYNNAVAVVNADNLLVEEYQTKVNELSAAPLTPSYANLDGANLTEANLKGCDLTLCSFIGSNFTDAIITNANFTSAILYDVNLTDLFLDGCNFNNAKLSGADFSNTKNMSGLYFTNADLRQSNFTNSNPAGAIFDNADMTGSMFKTVDLFISSSLSGFSTLRDVSFNGTILDDVILTKADFTGNINLKSISLTGSDLTNSILNSVDMSNSNLYNAVFNSVIAINAIFTSASMVRIDLSQSRLTGSIFISADISKAFLQSTSATSCDFQYTTMFSDDMRYSDFSHSKFNYANMVSCDLRNSKWHSNNFSYADMSKVKANKADFLYPILTGTKLSFLETQKVNLLKAS